MSGKFGITKDTKSSNVVPFQPSEAKPISLGFMTEVKADTREIKSSGEIKDVLTFKFIDHEKKRVHTHVEWTIDENDAKFDDKLAAMQSRIKHIFEAFAPCPENLGGKAKNMKEFFSIVADAFNVEPNMFAHKPVWLKIVYSIKYAKGGLQFPYSPNFIEPMLQGKSTTLGLDKKYDTVVQPSGSAATPDNFGTEFGATATVAPF